MNYNTLNPDLKIWIWDNLKNGVHPDVIFCTLIEQNIHPIEIINELKYIPNPIIETMNVFANKTLDNINKQAKKEPHSENKTSKKK